MMNFQEKLWRLEETQKRDSLDLLLEVGALAKKCETAFAARCEEKRVQGLPAGSVHYAEMTEEFGEIFIEHAGPLMVLLKRAKKVNEMNRYLLEKMESN